MKHTIRLLAVFVLAIPRIAAAAPKCKVVITPAQGSTVPEGSFEFNAKVEPASCSQSLTWSASEGIIQDGHFQAPVFAPSDKEPVKNITIVAKQTEDPHAEAYAFVKVSDGKAAEPPSNKRQVLLSLESTKVIAAPEFRTLANLGTLLRWRGL